MARAKPKPDAEVLRRTRSEPQAQATPYPHVILAPTRTAQAIDEENKPLAEQATRCARLFAQHVHADSYVPLVLSKLRQDALNTLSQRTQVRHSRRDAD